MQISLQAKEFGMKESGHNVWLWLIGLQNLLTRNDSKKALQEFVGGFLPILVEPFWKASVCWIHG